MKLHTLHAAIATFSLLAAGQAYAERENTNIQNLLSTYHTAETLADRPSAQPPAPPPPPPPPPRPAAAQSSQSADTPTNAQSNHPSATRLVRVNP